MLLHGALAYTVFLASFLYSTWLGGFIVAKTIDSGGPAAPLFESVVVNLLLLLDRLADCALH